MLKTVSSVANALGALNYKGTWDADTNTPTLASGVGNQGDYYVVSVAGATDLDGITNWGVGDWAAFNGSVWQRVEGGADGNFVNLEVTGNALIGTTTANTTYAPRLYTESALADGNGGILIGSYKPSATFLDFSGGTPAVHRIANDGGNLYFETDTNQDGTFDTVGAHFTSVGNLAFESGKGIDFSATSGTGTSELLDDYEEGIHTATLTPTTSGTIGLAGSANSLSYTKIGNMVNVTGYLYVSAISSPVGAINVSLPFPAADLTDGAGGSAAALSLTNIVSANVSDFVGRISETSSDLALYLGSSNNISATSAQQMQVGSQIQISVTYRTA